MGQKTHPKGFRLVTTQKHLSTWYSSKNSYPTLIEEDFFIRKKMEEVFREFLSISKVEITRIHGEKTEDEYVNITLHALFPRAKEMSRHLSKYFSSSSISSVGELKPPASSLQMNSKQNSKRFTLLLLKRTVRNITRFFQAQTKKNYYISFDFIKNPFEDATLVAKFIAEQLEKRTPFRRAVKQAIRKVQRTNLQGIKVQVSGRLNGAEMARTEWKRDGKIPLHTLNAKIDYTHQSAQTIYGVIGIKVWLFEEM